ncbi:MAG: DEAD/DEAH box helicase, partial [Anaerolineales bacterium]
STDTHWQAELEASFPYIETEDQIKVLKEVKADMEKPRPMDRLICGDVGYGKTEIALRAAFKCVMDGKQVAVLVPTTILAQQHFDTFRQRLAPFPIEVEMLSRFRTPQEQQRIIEKLSLGKIDIVIGTHRLLSNDVQFKDLGLLIIDEEQRFGVIHKEKLKKMRTEVDVLTLTATPIPRTLYLALSGVRDISTLNTPPEERIPILTHVGPYSPELIRKAILRELERGGQVFFVHNRVQTIYAMLQHLEKLVPEAQFTVAHGQMPEHELAERMRKFSNGEVDVLLSTSIIESGLDIPNANTLIVDRADTFGLAQLYQLRGRVGRGAQRAYAYFFRHRRKSPTLEGQQRLETIAENTQLGSGFNIAMRDLEIRGTGDILGTRQSGHVSAVGLNLYTRFLADAIQRLKKNGLSAPISEAEGIPSEMSLGVNVDLPLPANIPASYVPDKSMRLRLYRRVANIQSLSEIDQLAEEFQDRFGPLPEMTCNLFFQMKVKILAQKAGLIAVTIDNGQIALKFPEGEMPNLPSYIHPAARIGKTAIWFAFSTVIDWQNELIEILNSIAQITTPTYTNS